LTKNSWHFSHVHHKLEIGSYWKLIFSSENKKDYEEVYCEVQINDKWNNTSYNSSNRNAIVINYASSGFMASTLIFNVCFWINNEQEQVSQWKNYL